MTKGTGLDSPLWFGNWSVGTRLLLVAAVVLLIVAVSL